jgi:hypothetical protein
LATQIFLARLPPVAQQSSTVKPTHTNMTPDYKAEKKSSVTDLQGGGIWEINILTFLAPVCSPTRIRNRVEVARV